MPRVLLNVLKEGSDLLHQAHEMPEFCLCQNARLILIRSEEQLVKLSQVLLVNEHLVLEDC